jgi:hypothetical protein
MGMQRIEAIVAHDDVADNMASVQKVGAIERSYGKAFLPSSGSVGAIERSYGKVFKRSSGSFMTSQHCWWYCCGNIHSTCNAKKKIDVFAVAVAVVMSGSLRRRLPATAAVAATDSQITAELLSLPKTTYCYCMDRYVC